jgi:hypothetical protein
VGQQLAALRYFLGSGADGGGGGVSHGVSNLPQTLTPAEP